MQWLSDIMSWGSSALGGAAKAAPAAPSGAGFGLGQPLVVGDLGNAQYAASEQGVDWGGVAQSAAKGLLAGLGNGQEQQQQMQTGAETLRFGGQFNNPGAKSFSGLLSSNQNRANL